MTFSRRELLCRCGMGLGGLALMDLLAAAGTSDPLAPRRPHFRPRAKRVLHIFAPGGPSQMDTFDPKPALKGYAETKRMFTRPGRGEEPRLVLASPFAFRKCGESGIDVSELYPHLASEADEICVIRSMKTDTGSHQPATLLMNTGNMQLPRPSVGSWVTYGLGTENENLPAYVVLAPNRPAHSARNWQAAFLPGAFQGTFVNAAQADPLKMIPDVRSEDPADVQRRELDLLAKLNRRHQQVQPEDPRLESRIQSYELAYRMQAEALDAFDVEREPEGVRRLYGKGPEARMFLIARRLLERGVRYVQVWSAGWDHHEDLAVRLRESATIQDQPIAALLRDLRQRGMLEETLVIWGGEFGRTPTIQPPQKDGTLARLNGRDHNAEGFTMWLAGGGVKGGLVHGATDEMGSAAVENPVHVRDLHATILHLLGLDHEKLTYRYADRDFRLTDVAGKVVHPVLKQK